MRIIQIIQKKQQRGAETFASQISEHLLMQGHEVLIIVLFQGDSQLPFSGTIYELKANPKMRFMDWKAYKKIAKCINEFKPDIVQANASDSLKYAVFSKVIFKWSAPIVFRNASMISRYIQNPLSYSLNKILMKKVDRVISVSGTTKADFEKTFPFLLGKVDVVPVGIELGEQKTTNSGEKSEHLYVHVGGFTFEKNHKGLINIFLELSKIQPLAKLWLIGDGILMKEVIAQVEELGLKEKVVFWGNRQDVLALITNAKAFFLTSIIEGLPAVIIEAFYCKVPVVAYNVGAVGELVMNNETGFLVPVNNETAFIEAVAKLNSTKEMDTITDKAYELVMDSFLNLNIAKKLAHIYTTILNK